MNVVLWLGGENILGSIYLYDTMSLGIVRAFGKDVAYGCHAVNVEPVSGSGYCIGNCADYLRNMGSEDVIIRQTWRYHNSALDAKVWVRGYSYSISLRSCGSGYFVTCQGRNVAVGKIEIGGIGIPFVLIAIASEIDGGRLTVYKRGGSLESFPLQGGTVCCRRRFLNEARLNVW